MWEGALRLIETVGLKVPHAGIREILSRFDGVAVRGSIATFRRDTVLRAVDGQDYSDFPKSYGRNRPGIVTGAYEKYVLDLESGEIRPAREQDLIELTRLCDAFDLPGPPCVRANEVPVALQRLHMYKVSYEYSRNHAQGILDVAGWLNAREARLGKELAEAAGKEFRIDLWLISPFLAPPEGLAMVYEFKDEPVSMNVNTMPVAGTTSPIHLLDACIQSLAELFAGLTLLFLVNESKSRKGKVRCGVVDSIRAYPFDMRYGNFVYGSAEDLLGTLYQAQLNRRFRIPLVAKSLLTTGKLPDAHAAAEKAAHTMAATLAGACVFANAGLLAVDEIYSAEQLLIDREIVSFCQRVAQGDEFHGDLSALRDIEEVGHTGATFLEHEATLRDFRRTLWDPSLFTHTSLEQWLARGSRGPAQAAREIARETIRNHPYRIAADRKAEMDRILARAARELDG